MRIDEELLMDYFEMLENDKSVDLVVKLCDIVGIKLDKDDFIAVYTCNKRNEFNDLIVPTIIIKSKGWNAEINILDDRYIKTKEWKKNEYRFVRQISYDDNKLIDETFYLDIDGKKYLVLKQSDTYKTLCLDSAVKGVIRIHQNTKLKSIFGDDIEEIKCFSNELTTTEESYFNEIVYFESDEDFYDITIAKKKDQMFLAGATLNIPEFNLTGSKYTEDIIVYEQLGIIKGEDDKNVFNPPTIFMYGEHMKNGEKVKYVIKITKYMENINIVYGENTNSRTFKLVDREVGPISIQDLDLIIENIFIFLDTKAYQKNVIDYLTDIRSRLNYRQDHDLSEINSYNNDQIDRLLNDNGKTIEQQGFNMYINKEEIGKMLDNADIPSIDVNNNLIL